MVDGQYWDTCVFYAYLKGERHRAGELEALKNSVRRFDVGSLDIFTSTITMIEILHGKLDPSEIDQLRGMMERSNFTQIKVSPPVAQVAAEIRNGTAQYKQDGNIDYVLSTPDAIHIASCHVVDGVDQLITFDCENKKGKKELGMTRVADCAREQFGVTIMLRPDVSGQVECFNDE